MTLQMLSSFSLLVHKMGFECVQKYFLGNFFLSCNDLSWIVCAYIDKNSSFVSPVKALRLKQREDRGKKKVQIIINYHCGFCENIAPNYTSTSEINLSRQISRMDLRIGNTCPTGRFVYVCIWLKICLIFSLTGKINRKFCTQIIESRSDFINQLEITESLVTECMK